MKGLVQRIRRAWIGFGCVVLLSSLCTAEAHAAPKRAPLRLSTVLKRAQARHPELTRARQDVRRADGDRLASRGGLDTKVKLGAKRWVLGYYDKGQLEALLSQATTLYGAELYAGWRRSLGGRIPIYDGQIETLSGGEFRAGLELPLWRDGRIDLNRAGMRKADLESKKVRYELKAFRLLLANAAAHAYWTWVEAGRKLEIERELLRVAQVRGKGLERRAETGDAAGILLVDNQRSILSREARVVTATQKLRQAALKLSLFYRNSRGRPIVPSANQLPDKLPQSTKLKLTRLRRDIKGALKRRPEMRALKLEAKQAGVEADLWDNQTAPDIRLWAEGGKDFGTGSETLRPLDVALGVTVSVAVPMRKARGKAKAARAKRLGVIAKQRAQRDKIVADVKVAFTAMQAAHRLVGLARRTRQATSQLAEAERRKVALGSSDLLLLTIRETADADAAAKEAAALAEYQRMRANYLAATGRVARR